MDFTTADNILNDAAVELGIAAADVADPYGSLNQNIIHLRRLLKRVGRRLCRARDWTHQVREYTFPTVASTASYALPTDYARMRDGTHWNRTLSSPLDAPVESAEWQELKAQTASSGVFKRFRVWQGLFWLDPTPTGIETIAYEYSSNLWVVPTGATWPTACTNIPTLYTDTLRFDEDLLVAALKLAWKEAKGQDTSAVLEDFQQAWSAVAGGDGARPILSLSGGSSFVPCRPRLPDTGWGL
jgi:hypothetical protein